VAAGRSARRRRRELDRRLAAAARPLRAKTRYRQADAACRLDSAGADGALGLAFDAPQWAVTPGQSAVLYDGEVCLGGAVIASAAMRERSPVAA
jgi:tRNA U34 2-thiouridine synthase MnmA/TrmU